MMKRGLAAVALAAAAVLTVPTAALAEPLSYPPADNYITPPAPQLTPGGTTSVVFSAGSFAPGQSVSFTLTGWNASGATLAVFRTVVDSKSFTKAADSQGALSLAVTLPANASGSYTLTSTSGTWTRSWNIVVAGGGGAGGAGTGTQLAVSGSESNQMLWLWVAGGGLALAGGAVVVANSVRKQRKLAE